eukprot:COSAG05_NODE_2911_length_2516_cov_2.661150_2_plen_36_part_00
MHGWGEFCMSGGNGRKWGEGGVLGVKVYCFDDSES